MSGIVSLLFCGITLKHYAYHTMSRKTQRTTKYIFATLAWPSENFIFIYLGLSLFTSPPTSERVTNYIKPLFIAVLTVAVVFTHYAAVSPLSEVINLFMKHLRGQRHEELPHSYQMMLFWAGLCGAISVVLAARFKGDTAQTTTPSPSTPKPSFIGSLHRSITQEKKPSASFIHQDDSERFPVIAIARPSQTFEEEMIPR